MSMTEEEKERGEAFALAHLPLYFIFLLQYHSTFVLMPKEELGEISVSLMMRRKEEEEVERFDVEGGRDR